MPLILDGSLESEAILGHTAHWWCDAHVILVLWRLWQKYCQEFEASLLHSQEHPSSKEKEHTVV